MPLDDAALTERLEHKRADALRAVLKSANSIMSEATLSGSLGNSRLQLTLNDDAERIFVTETHAAAIYLWHASGGIAESKSPMLRRFAEGLRRDIIARRTESYTAAGAFGQSAFKATCCRKLDDRLIDITRQISIDFEIGIIGDNSMRASNHSTVNISNSNLDNSPVNVNQYQNSFDISEEIAQALRSISISKEFSDLNESQRSDLNDLTNEISTQIEKSPPNMSGLKQKLNKLQGFAVNVGATTASKTIADLIAKAAGMIG